MIISNLEITQAAIDMFFCFLCLIILLTIQVNNPQNKSMKMYVQLFAIAAALFVGEALAYIFRGNTGTFNIIANRLSNLIVFLMNVALAATYTRYIRSLILRQCDDINGVFIKLSNVFSCASICIILVNLIYPWMYYFDETNYYHRGAMWYVYTACVLIVIFSGAVMAVKYYKFFDKRSFITSVVFAFVPIIAIFVQTFIYGISIANFGLGMGLFAMFAAYLYDWMHESSEKMEQIKGSRIDIAILFVIMLFSISGSIVACGRVIQQVSSDNSKMQSRTIAQMVDLRIENELMKPIIAAQTMSQDINIKHALQGENREEAEAVKDEMRAQLESIRTGFGYQMVFAVSDKSKAYYTCNGISKYIDVVNDSHDIWYKEYLDSGKKYVANIDTDEDNNWELSVFVNYGVWGESGDFLGVCGTGVSIDDLVKIVSEYEEEYDVKIDLVNHDGLIQLDTDRRKIEASYLDNSYFDKVSGDNFYYQESDKCCYLTKYVDELDWYIVVRDNNPVKINVGKILFPIVIIFIAGVIIMVISFGLLGIKGQKAVNAYSKRYEVSIKDELTGLYNRRLYEDDMMNFPDVPPEADFVYASIDINGLKQVNDSLGHSAGDELIRGAAKCLKQVLGNYGKVYRTGGDEFISIFFADEEKLNFLMDDLEKVVGQWQGNVVSSLAVSVGYATKREFPDKTVEEMAAISDGRMYAEKEKYYSKKGVDRRGQAAAHKALCNLYTKILKINITNDTYSIVNMDMSEQTNEKGFSDTISEWLRGFGKSGNVHADDLDLYLQKTDLKYLREYFKQGKTSISVSYRRKYEDVFRQVAMEMIPADDYSDENQTLFLYVKNIDT